MSADPNFAQPAALIGEPTRAAILAALLGGKALTASELAHCAAVSPQTASMHLARLVDGGLLQVVASGRNRYYQLAGPEVARVLEMLATIAPPMKVVSLRTSNSARAVRFARTCYDHIAGTVGVALTERLIERELIADGHAEFQLLPAGMRWLELKGIDAELLQRGRRALIRPCLDWSERRNHVAGAFGEVLTTWLFDQGWIERIPGGRAVRLTELGTHGFAEEWELRF